MVRQRLVEEIEKIDFNAIKLNQLFQYDLYDSICFLVWAGALKNEMFCEVCGNQMNVQKRAKLPDGIWVWILFTKLNFFIFSGFVEEAKKNAQKNQFEAVLSLKIQTYL
jgi:hypothetical protein